MGVPLSICTWQLLLHRPFLQVVVLKGPLGLGPGLCANMAVLAILFLRGPSNPNTSQGYPAKNQNFPASHVYIHPKPKTFLAKALMSERHRTICCSQTDQSRRGSRAVKQERFVHSINRASSFDRDNPSLLYHVGNCPQGCGPYDTGLADPSKDPPSSSTVTEES